MSQFFFRFQRYTNIASVTSFLYYETRIGWGNEIRWASWILLKKLKFESPDPF